MYLRQLHLHSQCVDSCCTQHGVIFEWNLETLCAHSCRRTLHLKRMLGLRKDKSGKVGSGDLHGAMNGMRTASRDVTEFLAGLLTEHLGVKRGKLKRCLFVHESNESRVVSHVDDPLICAKPATLERFWMQITKLARVPVVCLGFEYRSVHEAERRGFTVKLTDKNAWTNAWKLFNCRTQRQ